MALIPKDKKHAGQVRAGTAGRRKGHDFERQLTQEINDYNSSKKLPAVKNCTHLFNGEPGFVLISYIIARLGLATPKKVRAWWLGGLATDSSGDKLKDKNGNIITKSKSDIVLDLENTGQSRVGVSVKTCYTSSPTNDQMFFTTASAFCELLRKHNIPVSKNAEEALKMFCGDAGFRPRDAGARRKGKDPDRWFWEELPKKALSEWQKIFSDYQIQVTEILFRKGYKDEPVAPDFLIHLTKGYDSIENAEFAIFSIDELVQYSKRFAGFNTREYQIRKGSFKNDSSVHLAPRFGFAQMQRGGQKQHPTQLQFNLMASYFYKLAN